MKSSTQTPAHISSPSQWLNIGWLILAIGLFFVHPLAGVGGLSIYAYKYLEVYCWRYEFYDNHVTEVKGVFSVTRETVNYFRIKSVMMEEPFWMRIFGLSIVSATTSEQYKPVFKFYGTENGQGLLEVMQEVAMESRKDMGIRDLDVFNSY
jgi:membrane protein YdbS with pleckstrin-like domain